MWKFIYTWIIRHYIEIFGALSGIFYIFFSIRKSLLLWPIGIITSIAYIIVFFDSTLYADMLLQVYYLLISFYGWYFWIKSKKNNHSGNSIKIISINLIEWIWTISATIILTAILYFPLHKYTNASNPFWDGLVTAGSIIATWMLARKIIEQWILWIIIDGISISLFVYKKLYPTAILFIIYTILAIFGYLKWKKDLKVQVN
jgi:nicotinamide mononucleotide transporter